MKSTGGSTQRKTTGPRVPPKMPTAKNGKLNGSAEAEVDLHELLHALQAVRVGDFTVRLPGDRVGIAGKIADAFNEIVSANQRMAQQLDDVGEVVGRQGKTRH